MVAEVLGARPGAAPPVSAGSTVSITIAGGTVALRLVSEDAARLGINVWAGDEAPSTAEDGPQPRTTSRPSAPIDLALGVASSAQLMEGDSVVLFLTTVDMGLVPEKPEDRIIVDPELGAISSITRRVVVPAFEEFGVFRLSEDQAVIEGGISLDGLRLLAARVSASDGPSLALDTLRDPGG